jgi:hypothetical protein
MSLPSDIIIKFKNYPELNIILDDNQTARDWKALFKKNYEREFPIFKDQKKYTLDYLIKLAVEANDKLGWTIDLDIKSIGDTVNVHKYIEHVLVDGFSSIPEAYDYIIHELHFCLHKFEQIDLSNSPNKTRQFLQLEWYNDDGVPLDENFQHKLHCEFGDVRLQNPYVGHIPLKVYQENDYSEIMQTCKFHDLIRPGVWIEAYKDQSEKTFDLENYVNWWNTYAPEFIAYHGIDKILHYTGHPVIGRVTNLDALETVVNSNDILELEYVFTK